MYVANAIPSLSSPEGPSSPSWLLRPGLFYITWLIYIFFPDTAYYHHCLTKGVYLHWLNKKIPAEINCVIHRAKQHDSGIR